MKSTKLRFILAILIAGLTGYVIGVTKINVDVRNFKPDIKISSKEPPASQMDLDFSQFWLVLDKIEGSYYDKKTIQPQNIINGANRWDGR